VVNAHRIAAGAAVASLLGMGGAAALVGTGQERAASAPAGWDALPTPQVKGVMSLEEVLAARRSVRDFSDRPLTRAELGQLCWAGQGLTGSGRRTAPSAGALYPIELYVATAEGVAHYRPSEHKLEPHQAGDVRPALRGAALDQAAVAQAPACFVIAADPARTARKYTARAERYCFLEAGHVAQNLLLQATALQLAGVPVGAFQDEAVAVALKLPPEQRVLYLVPIGHPRP
jgi:SagB-type dehydrogenase family enzyme